MSTYSQQLFAELSKAFFKIDVAGQEMLVWTAQLSAEEMEPKRPRLKLVVDNEPRAPK